MYRDITLFSWLWMMHKFKKLWLTWSKSMNVWSFCFSSMKGECFIKWNQYLWCLSAQSVRSSFGFPYFNQSLKFLQRFTVFNILRYHGPYLRSLELDRLDITWGYIFSECYWSTLFIIYFVFMIYFTFV